MNELFPGSALDCELERIKSELRVIEKRIEAKPERPKRLRSALFAICLIAVCAVYVLAMAGGLMYLLREL